LTVGGILGFTCFAVISSSLQMVAATDPRYIINTKLGLQTGGAIPLLVFWCAGFHPSSSLQEFRTVVSTVIYICIMSFCILGYFHSNSNLFKKAYKRLAYDLMPDESHKTLDETTKRLLADKNDPESAAEESELGIPSWVAKWQTCNGLVMGLAFCLVSLAGYFGDTELAQLLTSMKLMMEFAARIASSAIPQLPGFDTGPWHGTLSLMVVATIGAACVCFLRLLQVLPLGLGPLVAIWCFISFLSVSIASLVDVTTGLYVGVSHRKVVARNSQFGLVSGVLSGLMAGKAISMFMECRGLPKPC